MEHFLLCHPETLRPGALAHDLMQDTLNGIVQLNIPNLMPSMTSQMA